MSTNSMITIGVDRGKLFRQSYELRTGLRVNVVTPTSLQLAREILYGLLAGRRVRKRLTTGLAKDLVDLLEADSPQVWAPTVVALFEALEEADSRHPALQQHWQVYDVAMDVAGKEDPE